MMCARGRARTAELLSIEGGDGAGGVGWICLPSPLFGHLIIDLDGTSVTLFGTTFTRRARDNIVQVGVNELPLL
jgi:hypothetical protein